MLNMIPTQASAARGLLLAILVLVVLAGAAAAGAVVNGWRLTAVHAEELAGRDKAYGTLADKLREQSHAVSVMQVREQEADKRRRLAETYAQSVLGDLGKRSAAIASSKATDCDGVLRGAWR